MSGIDVGRKEIVTRTIISWTCCSDDVFDQQGIIEHLSSVHGLERPIQSVRRSVMHLDGSGWALNTYEHKIADLVLHQTVKTEDENPDASQEQTAGHP